ncbi:YaaL family protein [Clostridium formicaceticum]|uniref:DUF2508 domain-containing protein n=1 Tax=Clostridium formicaceticum TaxID=1497 RepID=A0AAC9RU13_9CLOT|nr:YaaL family protein [Clostridium formicaceticum]ARE89810.1 hypothetical protein CLFO_42930 [Clostridium formicaceticum]
MNEENQVTKREGILEGISTVFSGLHNKFQHFYETEKDENQEFIDVIKKARAEWESAEKTFHSVSDPDLIDYAIYNVEATKAKYIYLLKRAKEMGIKTNL